MQVIYWPGLTDYSVGEQRQQHLVTQVVGGATEALVFCQHTPVFTVGTGGDAAAEVLAAGTVPVLASGRGGKTTYHGPGQRVIYPVLDLNRRGRDVRLYVRTLQQWLIDSLSELGVTAYARDEVGVWVNGPQGPEKLAAIGIRVRRWVSFHGIALNVAPDLAAFTRIVPCGISDKGVTSLAKLGATTDMAMVDRILLTQFQRHFPPRP